MMIAIPKQHPVSPAEKAHLCASFGIELYILETLSSAISNKRNIMSFCHRVLEGYEMLMLNDFAVHLMFVINRFRLQRWERNPTSGNHGRAGSV